MKTVYDVTANDLIARASEKLKGLGLVAPEWVKYVKTGPHAERRPEQKDYWFTRCASLLRKAYIGSPIGVASLRTHYGGRKNRGVKPEKHVDAAGSQIRKGLQQLDKIGFIEKKKTGRYITGKGKAFLDGIAKEVGSKAQ